ncbi:carboxypeptidase-like regulatory domain-containing protein [Hymenobacter sp. BT523]|uniref:carboxypeptidase-like regulatory domain-containing protein n=1 Tax=Hymenobacter sp. BT523 TaxID=2795725 RepID=UPI0018EE1D4D|nr:carboxypeptidase-like regulatory domain-containing protein [Hymenobacter sp. BT523]MBJ6107994.1 carboxypeptidase-like regulatory domain-containing protein [Hymenobacter sp. BT523]
MTSLLRSVLCLCLGLPLLPRPAMAQQLSGTVSGATSQQPLPFVNIGLPARGLGTVSDEQGRYQLRYNPAYAADTVRISSVGFEPRLVPFAALLAAPNVVLTPAAVSLAEVSVLATNTKLRTHTLGLAKPSSHFDMHMSSNELGTELGTIIRLARRPTLVQTLHVAVVKNEAGPLTFRLNLYRLDAKGLPTNDKLLSRDVLLTASETPGVLTADLSADHLVVDQDFLLAVEWVKGADAVAVDLTKRLGFGGSLSYGYDIFMRRTSQAAWKKPTFKSNMPLLGLRPQVAFYTTVRD